MPCDPWYENNPNDADERTQNSRLQKKTPYNSNNNTKFKHTYNTSLNNINKLSTNTERKSYVPNRNTRVLDFVN